MISVHKPSLRLILLSLIVLMTMAAWTFWGRGFFSKDVENFNVIIISMDTTRQDKLSCYGYQKMTTPTLFDFANEKESILFSNAYSVTSWTLPAHASLLTGQIPLAHGAVFSFPESPEVPGDKRASENFPIGKLRDSLKTLAEVLQTSGYRCGGFVSGFFLKKFTGIAQGFETYDDLFPYKRIAEDTNLQALKWLEEVKTKKFFLFLNYFDPHKPYNIPDSFKIPQGLDDYEQELFYMDHNILQIFSWLKKNNVYDNSLIVITADHGEAFGETHLGFEEDGHGSTLYNEVIRIPLIIKFPKGALNGYKLEKEYSFNVQIIDIFPTVLDLLGIKPGNDLEGVALRPLIKNSSLKERAAKRVLTFYLGKNEKLNQGPRFHRTLEGVIKENCKFIRSSKSEKLFFDLEKDPNEKQNFYHENHKMAGDLEKFLNCNKEQYNIKELERVRPAFVKIDPERVKIRPEMYEKLRSLGYM